MTEEVDEEVRGEAEAEGNAVVRVQLLAGLVAYAREKIMAFVFVFFITHLFPGFNSL